MIKFYKTLIIIYGMLIPILLVGQNRVNQETGLKALDEQYGILNIKLETPFSAFKGLKMEDSENSIYKATQVELRLDKFKFEAVYFTFYKKLLTTVELETKGWNNTKGVLSTLQEAFGEGIKNAHNVYKWKSQKVWMNFAINEPDGDGVLSLHSVPLMTKEIGENE
jgi:hypothetical protein